MAELTKQIDVAIEDLSTLALFVQDNGSAFKQLPMDAMEAISLVKSDTFLRKMKALISLRINTRKVLQSCVDMEAQSEIEVNSVKLSFEQARIFIVQSHLCCAWSLYDLVAGFGRMFLHKNVGEENCNLKKMFILSKQRDNKLAMELLSKTVTSRFGLEIDLYYSIRNTFLHTSGLELDEAFIDDVSGATGYQLTEQASKQLFGRVEDSILANNPSHSLLKETDLLKLVDACEKTIDEACALIIAVSVKVLDGLLHTLIPEATVT